MGLKSIIGNSGTAVLGAVKWLVWSKKPDETANKYSNLSEFEKYKRDPEAFKKDCDRMAHNLIYNGHSVYEHHKNKFDELNNLLKPHLDKLGALQSEFIEHQARLSEIEDKTSDDYDMRSDYCDFLEDKITRLKEQISEISDDEEGPKNAIQTEATEKFTAYLLKTLGPSRRALIPEIMWRFSQKATTLVYGHLTQYLYGKCGITPQDAKMQSKCELIIPDDQNKPVQIIASTRSSYGSYTDHEGEHKLKTPISVNALAVYTLKIVEGRGITKYSEIQIDFENFKIASR